LHAVLTAFGKKLRRLACRRLVRRGFAVVLNTHGVNAVAVHAFGVTLAALLPLEPANGAARVFAFGVEDVPTKLTLPAVRSAATERFRKTGFEHDVVIDLGLAAFMMEAAIRVIEAFDKTDRGAPMSSRVRAFGGFLIRSDPLRITAPINSLAPIWTDRHVIIAPASSGLFHGVVILSHLRIGGETAAS
jgi:hypothetical protein